MHCCLCLFFFVQLPWSKEWTPLSCTWPCFFQGWHCRWTWKSSRWCTNKKSKQNFPLPSLLSCLLKAQNTTKILSGNSQYNGQTNGHQREQAKKTNGDGKKLSAPEFPLLNDACAVLFSQMHEMLHLLPHDKDSESGSYTDSGRGPSEEGDNSLDRPAMPPGASGNPGPPVKGKNKSSFQFDANCVLLAHQPTPATVFPAVQSKPSSLHCGECASRSSFLRKQRRLRQTVSFAETNIDGVRRPSDLGAAGGASGSGGADRDYWMSPLARLKSFTPSRQRSGIPECSGNSDQNASQMTPQPQKDAKSHSNAATAGSQVPVTATSPCSTFLPLPNVIPREVNTTSDSDNPTAPNNPQQFPSNITPSNNRQQNGNWDGAVSPNGNQADQYPSYPRDAGTSRAGADKSPWRHSWDADSNAQSEGGTTTSGSYMVGDQEDRSSVYSSNTFIVWEPEPKINTCLQTMSHPHSWKKCCTHWMQSQNIRFAVAVGGLYLCNFLPPPFVCVCASIVEF